MKRVNIVCTNRKIIVFLSFSYSIPSCIGYVCQTYWNTTVESCPEDNVCWEDGNQTWTEMVSTVTQNIAKCNASLIFFLGTGAQLQSNTDLLIHLSSVKCEPAIWPEQPPLMSRQYCPLRHCRSSVWLYLLP